MVQNVLVIDDIKTERIIAKATIEAINPNINVHLAASGPEALEWLQKTETRVDLILLDIKMPEMDGYDFLQCLNDLFPEIETPVIMLTGSHQLNDIQRAMHFERIDGYCFKPIVRESLEAMLAPS